MAHRYCTLWDIMQRCPVTLASAKVDADGLLHTEIISGPDFGDNSSLPEEGLFLICRERALLIAAPCYENICGIAQICRCYGSEQEQAQHVCASNTTAAAFIVNTERRRHQRRCISLKNFISQDSVLSRLYFFEAVDAAHSLQFSLLAYPQTLTLEWEVNDDLMYHIDTWFEEPQQEQQHSPTAAGNSGNGNDKGYKGKKCPVYMMDVLCKWWKKFLERGDHQSRLVKIFSEPGWDKEHKEHEGWNQKDQNEDEDGNKDDEDNNWIDVSEWDDADTPIHSQTSTSTSTHAHAHAQTQTHPHPHVDEHTSIATSSIQHTDNDKKRPWEEEEGDFDCDLNSDFDMIEDVMEDFPPILRPQCVSACEISKYRQNEKVQHNTLQRSENTKDAATQTPEHWLYPQIENMGGTSTLVIRGAKPQGSASAVQNPVCKTEITPKTKTDTEMLSPVIDAPKEDLTARDFLISYFGSAQ
ncbi:hypothetical protein F5B17DRAFT_428039 [Nemania serpens]|nr:hypothetical protein F5B17DRAFT_428039 [Nemania serpens]